MDYEATMAEYEATIGLAAKCSDTALEGAIDDVSTVVTNVDALLAQLDADKAITPRDKERLRSRLLRIRIKAKALLEELQQRLANRLPDPSP